MPLESREQDAPEDALRSPLDDIFVDFLMSKKRESPDLDFKLTVDVSRYRFSDVAKDIFAMANYGGGYILIGFKQKETGGFEPVGVPQDFHVDQADLQQKFNAYCSDPLDIGYREFDYEVKEESGQLVIHKFALINAPPSTTALSPKNDGIVRSPDGREKTVFRRGEVLIRRGTQSTRASPAEVEWIKKRAEDAEYRISLISGNTDRIPEKLPCLGGIPKRCRPGVARLQLQCDRRSGITSAGRIADSAFVETPPCWRLRDWRRASWQVFPLPFSS